MVQNCIFLNSMRQNSLNMSWTSVIVHFMPLDAHFKILIGLFFIGEFWWDQNQPTISWQLSVSFTAGIHHCPFNWGFSKDYLPYQLFWRFESGRRCCIFVHQLDMILKWKRWKSHWLKIVFCQSMTELANCQLEFKIDSDPTRRQQFTHHQIFSSSWNIWRVVDFKPAIYYLKFCAKKLLSILQKKRME